MSEGEIADMIGFLSAVTVAASATAMHQSDKIRNQAEEKNIRSMKRIARANAEQLQEEEKMNTSLQRLFNRKKAILQTSLQHFLITYEKIIKINFLPSDGIRELDSFTPAVRKEIVQVGSIVQKGFDSPTITKGVVAGFLFGGICGAALASIKDDAKKELDLAKLQAKRAAVIEEQARAKKLSYHMIEQKANQIADVLTKCNIMFEKNLGSSDEIIEKNGMDRKKYSEDERKILATCINIAGAVKSLIDLTILQENGEINQKIESIVKLGNDILMNV